MFDFESSQIVLLACYLVKLFKPDELEAESFPNTRPAAAAAGEMAAGFVSPASLLFQSPGMQLKGENPSHFLHKILRHLNLRTSNLHNSTNNRIV